MSYLPKMIVSLSLLVVANMISYRRASGELQVAQPSAPFGAGNIHQTKQPSSVEAIPVAA